MGASSPAGGYENTLIYTITVSPSLDRVIDVEEFMYDDVNKIVEEKRSAGGKAIDVSRVIKELGGQSIALGFMGGYNGIEVESRVSNEGIVCDFTRVNAETRENIIINQRRKKTQTFLSSTCAEVTQFDISTLYNKIRQIPRDSYVVVTGGLPPGINDSFYAQIIAGLKDKNIKVFLDADGEEIRKGVQAGPYLIKPNIHELGRLVDRNMKDTDEVLAHISPLLASVENVVVSMGMRGALGISGKERYLVTPPKVNVKSSSGAGDALLAGMAYGLSEGAGFKDALVLGVACGTASTLSAEPARCSREDVYTISKEIQTKNV